MTLSEPLAIQPEAVSPHTLCLYCPLVGTVAGGAREMELLLGTAIMVVVDAVVAVSPSDIAYYQQRELA